MTNHPNRHPGAPMRRESYLKLVRELRESADRIEAMVSNGLPDTPQGRRALSMAVTTAARNARRGARRHYGRNASCWECGEPQDK